MTKQILLATSRSRPAQSTAMIRVGAKVGDGSAPRRRVTLVERIGRDSDYHCFPNDSGPDCSYDPRSDTGVM